MSQNMMDSHCSACSHEWKDKPGQWADCYNAGCPECGSLYWVSKEHDDE